MSNLTKKGKLYFPGGEAKKRAWLNNESIYKKAEKDPVKFWEELAKKGIVWKKKWQKPFEFKLLGKNRPPSIKWFLGGRLNITESCLDRHIILKKNTPAIIWEPEPVSEKTRVLTYGELLYETNRFANVLKKMGVKKGDRVGIYLPMIPEAVISMLACSRIGAVHAVVFSAFSSSALKLRLQDNGAKILITADGYWRRGKQIPLKESADEAVKGTKVKKIIVVKRLGRKAPFKKGRDFWWNDTVGKEAADCKAVSMSSEDLHFILYTSGSTGKPKGCCHTCGGYAVQANWTGKWIFDWRDKDIFWCTADIGWVTGHTYAVYSPLLNGITSLFFEGVPDFPMPDRWAKIIEKNKVTSFYTAPTAIRVFEKTVGNFISKYKFKNIRLIGSVGEPIDEDAWHWFFKNVGKKRCPLVDTWWQTETGGVLISSLPGIGPFKPSFSGKPFPGMKFEIFDDNGKRCADGKPGNLALLYPFAPALLRGVYKNPEKYFETYWKKFGKKIYFSSDGAYKLKNGMIRIVGRVDDVIKVAGHRLTTGEMENAISILPEVTECAVIGKKDALRGEVPVAFVVCKKTSKTEEQIKKDVIENVRKEIGPVAFLKEVYVVQDLPKTRSGKIMRRILKAIFNGEQLGDLSTLADSSVVERIKLILRQV